MVLIRTVSKGYRLVGGCLTEKRADIDCDLPYSGDPNKYPIRAATYQGLDAILPQCLHPDFPSGYTRLPGGLFHITKLHWRPRKSTQLFKGVTCVTASNICFFPADQRPAVPCAGFTAGGSGHRVPASHYSDRFSTVENC